MLFYKPIFLRVYCASYYQRTNTHPGIHIDIIIFSANKGANRFAQRSTVPFAWICRSTGVRRRRP